MQSHAPQSESKTPQSDALQTTEANIRKTLTALKKEKVRTCSFHPEIPLPEKPGKRNYHEINPIQDRLLKAATSYHPSAIDKALAKLDNDVLTRKDKKGNTFLHLAVLYNNSSMVAYILKKLREKASILCRTQNHFGAIPLYLAHEIPNIYVKTKMIKLLLPKSLDYSIKPLSSHLNAKEIPEHYPETATNPVLKRNLEIAYEVINQCRNEILYSNTHPDTNQMDTEQKNHALAQVRKVRFFNINGSWRVSAIKKHAEKIKEYKAGNCVEYATLAIAHILEKKLPHPLTIESFTITAGDHYFAMLDCSPTRTFNQFDTYGRNAVYLDAWAGEAIPVQSAKFIQKLNTYASVDYNYNLDHTYTLLPKFNPRHNALLSLAKFHIQPVEVTKDKTSTLIEKKHQKHESKPKIVTFFSKKQPASSVTSAETSFRVRRH